MRYVAGLICGLLLAACGDTQQATESDSRQAVVLYAPGESDAEVAMVFDSIGEQTGIRTAVKWGQSAELTDAVINKTGIPADLLLTDNAYDIWRAAEQGALRPATSAAVSALPDWARDVDKYWIATEVRYPRIVAASQDATAVSAAPGLNIDAVLQGRLCLSSFSEPLNAAFVAHLINEYGVRETEREVRRWLRRSDSQIFDSTTQLLEALHEGTCELALLSDAADAGELPTVLAFPHYPSVWAMGIGRHAQNPEAAQAYLAFVAELSTWGKHLDDTRSAAIAGYRAEEARQLAERVGWN